MRFGTEEEAITAMTALTLHPDNGQTTTHPTLTDPTEIARALSAIGVRYERWETKPLDHDAQPDEILVSYQSEIDQLKAAGGYQTADVVRMLPDAPNREEMRSKFLDEHIHTEDEVRFFVEGSGAFYLHGPDTVYQMICTQGDLISVPAGLKHWFDMGPAPFFTAVRLFTNPDGWVAQFTGDPIAQRIPLYEQEAA